MALGKSFRAHEKGPLPYLVHHLISTFTARKSNNESVYPPLTNAALSDEWAKVSSGFTIWGSVVSGPL